MNKLKIFGMLFTTMVLITGCVDSEKGKLDNRVLAFWHAKINKDFKTAYEFLSPGWKSNESEYMYLQRMGSIKVKWLDVSLLEKSCSQTNLCSVALNIKYSYTFNGVRGREMKVETKLNENWIMKDNVWYNVPEKAKFK